MCIRICRRNQRAHCKCVIYHLEPCPSFSKSEQVSIKNKLEPPRWQACPYLQEVKKVDKEGKCWSWCSTGKQFRKKEAAENGEVILEERKSMVDALLGILENQLMTSGTFDVREGHELVVFTAQDITKEYLEDGVMVKGNDLTENGVRVSGVKGVGKQRRKIGEKTLPSKGSRGDIGMLTPVGGEDVKIDGENEVNKEDKKEDVENGLDESWRGVLFE